MWAWVGVGVGVGGGRGRGRGRRVGLGVRLRRSVLEPKGEHAGRWMGGQARGWVCGQARGLGWARVGPWLPPRRRLSDSTEGGVAYQPGPCHACAGRVGLASVRFAGHPQEIGNEEFLARKRSHQVPGAVRGTHRHVRSRAARVRARARVRGCAGARVWGCGVWVCLAPTLALTLPWHEAGRYARPYSDPNSSQLAPRDGGDAGASARRAHQLDSELAHGGGALGGGVARHGGHGGARDARGRGHHARRGPEREGGGGGEHHLGVGVGDRRSKTCRPRSRGVASTDRGSRRRLTFIH